jgi:hypothetical protein
MRNKNNESGNPKTKVPDPTGFETLPMMQCCGFGSGIRDPVLFDPRFRISDPGSQTYIFESFKR